MSEQERLLVMRLTEMKFHIPTSRKGFVPVLHKCRSLWLFSMFAYADLCLLKQQNELFSEFCINVHLQKLYLTLTV